MLARWESPTAVCLVVVEATEERVTGEELSFWPSEPDSTEPEMEPENPKANANADGLSR